MSLFHRQQGFTLLELLITLSIVSILFAISAPQFGETIAKNRVSATTDSVIRTVQLARSESIKRGNRVVACLSDHTLTCNPASSDRILVFSDENRSGQPSITDDIIKTIEFDPDTATVSYNRPYLGFAATGYAAGTNGTFKVCDISGRGDFVIVSSLGRARKGRDYDGDGIVEKPPGTPINC